MRPSNAKTYVVMDLSWRICRYGSAVTEPECDDPALRPLLENIQLTDKERADRESERDDELRKDVPDVQVFHKRVHEAGIQSEIHDLQGKVERKLNVRIVRG